MAYIYNPKGKYYNKKRYIRKPKKKHFSTKKKNQKFYIEYMETTYGIKIYKTKAQFKKHYKGDNLEQDWKAHQRRTSEIASGEYAYKRARIFKDNLIEVYLKTILGENYTPDDLNKLSEKQKQYIRYINSVRTNKMSLFAETMKMALKPDVYKIKYVETDRDDVDPTEDIERTIDEWRSK